VTNILPEIRLVLPQRPELIRHRTEKFKGADIILVEGQRRLTREELNKFLPHVPVEKHEMLIAAVERGQLILEPQVSDRPEGPYAPLDLINPFKETRMDDTERLHHRADKAMRSGEPSGMGVEGLHAAMLLAAASQFMPYGGRRLRSRREHREALPEIATPEQYMEGLKPSGDDPRIEQYRAERAAKLKAKHEAKEKASQEAKEKARLTRLYGSKEDPEGL
jgi:hypothetical protein